MIFRPLAFFALAASVLSVLATPTHLEQRAAAADNIVYVTDADKFWYALLSRIAFSTALVPTAHSLA